MSQLDRRGFLQGLVASLALAPFAGMAMTERSPSIAGLAPEQQDPASTKSDSPAVIIARAHIEAWSNHDFASARKSLAGDIHFTATSMQPAMTPTDLVGIDNYMTGLVRFAQAVVPGSARVIASIGDERDALVMVTVKVKAFLGLGTPKTLPMARLYLLDGQGKIKGEQVIFYVDRS
ncbi:nuclear transport factor 2 family protein [Rhodanobacter sp. C06]|uniref:nuclear transport factor 2 family protein n=1 Tax=Rhodanobacter sp. C06 TaxID=1945854 RepID=UPI000986CE2F|nr:nuclear transport factor 2 family protein [Rhodanobacter sp. C06]